MLTPTNVTSQLLAHRATMRIRADRLLPVDCNSCHSALSTELLETLQLLSHW